MSVSFYLGAVSCLPFPNPSARRREREIFRSAASIQTPAASSASRTGTHGQRSGGDREVAALVEPRTTAACRVLYVDPNTQMRRPFTRALARHGFEVVAAGSEADATLQFHAHAGQFDVILTAHDLTDGTGFQLGELLRATGYKGRIVVLAELLAESDLALYEKCAISGFFRKPFKLEMLVSMLLK